MSPKPCGPESCSATKASPSEKPIPPTSNGRSRHSTACWTSWTKRGFRSKSHGGSTKNTTECCKGSTRAKQPKNTAREQVPSGGGATTWPPTRCLEDDPRNPRFDVRYACVPDAELPRTESLEQTIARILPYWHCVVFPSLMRYDSLLVVARQFAARRHQASQRNPRRPDRRAQPADGRTLCLRVRRRAASRTRLLSRRPRRDPPPSRGRRPTRQRPLTEEEPDFCEIRLLPDLHTLQLAGDPPTAARPPHRATADRPSTAGRRRPPLRRRPPPYRHRPPWHNRPRWLRRRAADDNKASASRAIPDRPAHPPFTTPNSPAWPMAAAPQTVAMRSSS